MTISVRTVAAFVAVGAVALTGACSSNEDAATRTSSSASTNALTTDEFVAQGNAICEAAIQQMQENGPENFDNATPAEQQAFIDDTMVPIAQGMVGELRALIPPPELQDQVDQVLAEYEAAVDSGAPQSFYGGTWGEIGLTGCENS